MTVVGQPTFFVQTFARDGDEVRPIGPRQATETAQEAEVLVRVLTLTATPAVVGAVAVVMTRDAYERLLAVGLLAQHGEVPEGYGVSLLSELAGG